MRGSGGCRLRPPSSLTPLPSRPSLRRQDRDNEEYDYEDLAALASLRRRLNRALVAFDRVKAEYVAGVVFAIEVGDVVACREAARAGGDTLYRSSLRPPRTGPHARLLDAAEYVWRCRAERYCFRALSVVLAFTSCVLVLAEATIWLGLTHLPNTDRRAWRVEVVAHLVPTHRTLYFPSLSIVSLMIESAHGGDISTKLLVGLVLMYMACLRRVEGRVARAPAGSTHPRPSPAVQHVLHRVADGHVLVLPRGAPPHGRRQPHALRLPLLPLQARPPPLHC